MVKDLNTPICRYPGGNFVSAYNWEDGIDPKEDSPVRLDLAWHSSERNQLGIDEFCNWCETVGTELMLAVNLGLKGLDEARNLFEYCNHSGVSYYSDLRKNNGREFPWNIQTWCLGYEMDGKWHIGHKTVKEYGKLAANTARAMKSFDDSLELVVCGSSDPNMPTFTEWDAKVLEETYDHVNYISLHQYFGLFEKLHTQDYLSLNIQMEYFIDKLAGTISYVKAKKRSKHNVFISFDEWNCWYHSLDDNKKY